MFCIYYRNSVQKAEPYILYYPLYRLYQRGEFFFFFNRMEVREGKADQEMQASVWPTAMVVPGDAKRSTCTNLRASQP